MHGRNGKYKLDVKRTQRLIREGGWVLLGQSLMIAGSLVGVRFLTELLTPAAYGELALGMSAALLVNQVAFGPLRQGATRFYAPSVEAGELRQYLGSIVRLTFFLTVVTIILSVLTIIGLALIRSQQWIGIVVATMVFAVFSGFSATVRGIENAARRRSIVAVHEGTEAWVRFLIAGFFILWLGATSTIAMAGYAVAVSLVFGSQYFFFRRALSIEVSARSDSEHWRSKILRYSWPFGTWGVFFWAQRASERWALGLFAGVEEVGMYAVLFQLGYFPMSLATDMAMRLVSPVIFQRAGDASDVNRLRHMRALCLRLTGIALMLTLTAFFVTFWFNEQIFALFAGEKFRSLSRLLPWMVLNGGMFAAGQSISLILMTEMKTRSMISAKISTALIGVASNIAGAYWFQTIGVVYAGVLVSALYLVWMTSLSNSFGKKLLY